MENTGFSGATGGRRTGSSMSNILYIRSLAANSCQSSVSLATVEMWDTGLDTRDTPRIGELHGIITPIATMSSSSTEADFGYASSARRSRIHDVSVNRSGHQERHSIGADLGPSDGPHLKT